ncbi:related to conserved hypothetical Ustilaginaceae-specific protein [Ustilago trichophora]|uniref:Related to conserved hypothetical Ustilaginaceae-specific protein n=1 Tax=Ustilago trichophora TaxID=86804 RepID=A0A5C3EPF5_9BASI|nr:related to conserved hypothetical Ustilaginaceae-specific protein [Ustilago trichophora]
MQIFKAIPLCVLLGAAHAVPALQKRGSRAECLRYYASLTAEKAPIDYSVALCYHGDNSAVRAGDSTTDKRDGHYGYSGYYKCHGVGLDCFWMKGLNAWSGYGDAGSDNIAMYIGSNCVYHRDTISVTCT